MTEDTPTKSLGAIVRAAREVVGLSIRGCAEAAGVDATWLSRLERGDYTSPDPRHLAELARVLEIDLADLYAASGYQPATTLPSLRPYLRAKYDLPHDAIVELNAHFELLAEKYQRQDRGAA